MEAIKIEKHIPIPRLPHYGGRKPTYPWRSMDVGDSFVFPSRVKKSTALSLTYKTSKQNGKKFVVRSVSEGIRCWRLA